MPKASRPSVGHIILNARRTTPGRMSSRTSRMEARAAVPGMAGAGEERWRDYRLGSREPWSLAADSWKCLRVYTIGMCCTACWLRLLFITSSSVLFSPRQSQGGHPGAQQNNLKGVIQMASTRERGAAAPLPHVRACQRLRPAMLRRWPAAQ